MDNYLERLQNKEIEMLKAISNVCDKLDLTYVIISGTLLGSVRHRGFIPWDDDIDIGMPREDYEVFLKEGQKLLPSNLFIQHYSTERETNNLYIKVRDVNTVFLENDNQNANICHGIFIDVFPFDRIKTSFCGPKREYYRRRVFNIISGCYSKEYVESVRNPYKRMVGKLIHKTICSLKDQNSFLKKEDLRRKKLNSCGNDCYLLNMFIWNDVVTYEELFDRELMQFGEEEFYGPKQYDKVLTKYYGADYMQLPPVEKRITHKPLKVIFDIAKER